MLRELLATTSGVDRTRDFARGLRRSARPGGLLLVGTPTEEPWHLAAHLDDEARLAGAPELSPTLVRWSPPADAPPHLSVTLARLEAARRDETLFVVAPDSPPESLLERLSDARRIGATILSIDDGDDDLAGLANDRLVVPSPRLLVPEYTGNLTSPDAAAQARGLPVDIDIDAVQHLVSVAAGESTAKMSLRDRLAQILHHVSGPPPER
jgi:hypothetical protein